MKQMIENPNEVDWVGFWKEILKDKKDKDWDKAAVGFYKRYLSPRSADTG